MQLIIFRLDKEMHPKLDIQIVYKGNFSTFCTHISRKDMETHYSRYRKACVEKGYDLHERCVPPKEKERLERLEKQAAGIDAESGG